MISNAVPPHDEEAESSVIGAGLLAPKWVSIVATEVQLRPEHFYRPRHRIIFAEMLAMDAELEAIDTLTVADRLKERNKLEEAGGRDYLETMVTGIPAIGNTKQYAQIIKENAMLRHLLAATQNIQESIATREGDPKDLVANAYKLINDVGDTEHQGAYSPDDLMDLAVRQLTSEPAERFPLGFAELGDWTNGGLARGQVMTVASWPNCGKSIFVDQLSESMVSGTDRRACIYLTEMTVIERNARFIARNTDLSIGEAIRGNLSGEQMRRAGNYKPPPIHVQPASGWTVDEICRDIIRRRWDVAVVDHINRISIDYRNGRQSAYADMSARFNTVAKDNQANCVLLLVSHLSRHSNKDENPPKPKEAHLRETQMLAADADICCFLHREIDQFGRKSLDTEIYFTRNRTGPSGASFFVALDQRNMKFNPTGRF